MVLFRDGTPALASVDTASRVRNGEKELHILLLIAWVADVFRKCLLR